MNDTIKDNGRSQKFCYLSSKLILKKLRILEKFVKINVNKLLISNSKIIMNHYETRNQYDINSIKNQIQILKNDFDSC